MSISAFSHVMGTETIQPYFVLSSRSRYYKKSMGSLPIANFYSFIADNDEGHVLAVPDACVDILFLCDSRAPEVKVCGTTITAKQVELRKGCRYFGVRFKPGYVPPFLSITPRELIDSEIALEVLDKQSLKTVEKIVMAGSFDEQIKHFMHRYEGLLLQHQPSLCQQLSYLINQRNGDIRIGELEEHTQYSARYIYKVCVEHFGLSPKLYCLILRFQQSLLHLTHQKQQTLTDLALTLGYADQSHFLREFKKFAAVSPKHFSTVIHNQGFQQRIENVCF